MKPPIASTNTSRRLHYLTSICHGLTVQCQSKGTGTPAKHRCHFPTNHMVLHSLHPTTARSHLGIMRMRSISPNSQMLEFSLMTVAASATYERAALLDALALLFCDRAREARRSGVRRQLSIKLKANSILLKRPKPRPRSSLLG